MEPPAAPPEGEVQVEPQTELVVAVVVFEQEERGFFCDQEGEPPAGIPASGGAPAELRQERAPPLPLQRGDVERRPEDRDAEEAEHHIPGHEEVVGEDQQLGGGDAVGIRKYFAAGAGGEGPLAQL